MTRPTRPEAAPMILSAQEASEPAALVLAELVKTVTGARLVKMADGRDAVAGGRPRPAPALLWRLNRVAHELDISRRALERERSAGRFPPPDRTIGRMPLWRPESIRRWIEGGGCP